ncbi:MAG: hypothetical protein WC575_01910 [Patescibacteria group bacterium]
MKYFSYIIIAIVAICVIAGFFIVGSPKEERLMRLDDQRIQDLQSLQSEIIYYWQNKNQLPTQLTNLIDNISGFYPPQDPETGLAYTYEVTGNESFKLCATFSRTGSGQNQYLARPIVLPQGKEITLEQDNWQHQAGYVCFDRTIDKDLYKLKDQL